MRIEFELINKELVRIIGIDANGKRNNIGEIFTPSGSGNDSLNAIQVCGFKEAFDLWGCARYIYPKLNKEETSYQKDVLGTIYQHAKDIQLMYDDETVRHVGENREVCEECYNDPCTCEKILKSGPYTVKRENELKLLEKVAGPRMKAKIRILDGLEEKHEL